MIRSVFIILTLITLSGCTIQKTGIADDSEKNKYTVYNILGPFGIDFERSALTLPLIEIQNSCMGQDFTGYRQCFLSAMRERQDLLTHNSEEKEFFDTFSDTLQKEIEYYPYYQELDEMKYPEDDLFSLENKDCYIVSAGSFRTEYEGTISESSIPIDVSYTTNERDTLVSAFPSWSDAITYNPVSFSGYGYDPNNPCLYRTFGPSYGNIIYTEILGNNLYVFIKVNGGAGSGEFYYSVYVYSLISHEHVNIGGFWAWSGIIPFRYNLNMEIEKVSIIEIYKNKPFFYYQLFENRRIHGDTVESIYLKSIK